MPRVRLLYPLFFAALPILHLTAANAPGSYTLSDVVIAVAVGVAEKPEDRRFGDEESSADMSDRAGHEEVVGENRVGVEAAIAVGVGKQSNAASALVFAAAFDIGHEGAHFEDIHVARGIELDFDGSFDLGFGSDEFDAEAGLEPEGFEGVVWGERWRGRDLH